MRQYARPPEGNDYANDDHKTAAIIASGIMAAGCIVSFMLIVLHLLVKYWP